jgi:ABC-type oligopeptide transport system substrate-binding subunit
LKLSDSYPVLYVGVRKLPDYLSPGTAFTDCERQVIELLFESLVKPVYEPGHGQRYVPGLAEGRPRLVSLGRQFQLAEGARWSNGERVTTTDVQGTVRLLKDKDWLGYSPEWADLVESPRADELFRFNLKLHRGYFDPLALMTFKVLPAANLRHMDDPNFAAKPIGSGPFQYQGRKIENNREYAIFLANPNFGNRAGKEHRPLIREVRLFQCEEPVIDFQRKRGGSMHLALDLRTDQLESLASPEAGLRNEVQVVTLRNRRVYFLAVNQRRPLLQSQDVRKAISYAVDREKILNDQFRVGLEDRAKRSVHRWLNGPYPRGSWACAPGYDDDDPSKPYYPFQPNRVKSLADRAQMNGKKLTLKYPNDDPRVERACGYVQTQVQNATGLTIELKGLSPRELRQQVEIEHDYDLAYYHWDYANEAYWLWPLFDPEATGRGGRNFLGVNDPVLQGLFRSALVHREFEKVKELTHHIHRELFEKMPLIPLWQLDTHLALHRELQTVPPPSQLDPQVVFAEIENWKLGK